MTERIIFGNEQSEKEYNVKGASLLHNGGRKLLPTNPPSRFSSEITFNIKVDPYKQNYFSLKLHSKEKYTPIYLYLDGKQLGYAKCSDYEALNLGYGRFNPADYFFVTTAIPIGYTKGKSEITLTLRQAEPYDTLDEIFGTIYEGYTSTSPNLSLPKSTATAALKAPKEYTCDDIAGFSQSYINSQVEFFNSSLKKLRQGEKLSITKYVEELRHFIMVLFEPYCPLADKSEAIVLILNCINLYVKDYFENPKTLLHNAHQSDWGGYYGELGQGLYLIEPFLNREEFLGYLSTPFNEHLTKKEAWELCLKANFDFASSRQSYIYNQTYYTYEGAWKAMAGLGVIGSKYYIGKEKCDLILKEALGLAPWKGEHILFDENGKELDLYHCLFNHDRSARFTDDYINVVCTGKAVQGIDENGEFIRRRPYGESYYPLTHRALSRENGYVGNYGETANYLPEWVYRTFNHGDFELSDLILKAALENINSRMYMRYEGADEEGCRIMLMEQAIDERNPTMTPKSAYGAIIHDKRTLHFASLLRHMEENKRYSSPEWDKYKAYARKALDALRQQHLDGHLDVVLESLGANYNDFKADRTIRDIFSDDIKYYLPHSSKSSDTDFVFFDIDNLLLSLRDGTTHIFAQLNHRNRGYSAFGRAHIIKDGTHQLMQFATDALFETKETFIRQQNVNMDFIADSQGSNSYARGPVPLCEFGATPQALCGEEQSVTYQKGVGKINRENFEVDTPYTGYPDFIWAKIDKYLVVCNTTRESYGNEKNFTLPFKVKGETVSLAPFSYRVIKTEEEIPTPSSVKHINAIVHKEGVLLSWKMSEGESYNIYRNGERIATSKACIYLDKAVRKNSSYTYSVCSVNSFGESHMSPSREILFTDLPQCIGSFSGKAHFGEGNDYRALERSICDALPYYASATFGSVSCENSHSVMAREAYDSNCRYAYMGFEDGKIVIRTRSKNTTYTFSEKRLSPLYYEFDKGDYTRLKLLVDKRLHSVCFFAGKNGEWTLLHREVLPLPAIFYVGSLSKQYSFQKEEYDYPFPIMGAEYSNGILTVQKGLDNKYLIVESSLDGKSFITEKDDLVSQNHTTPYKPYFRITPINRHGVKGDSIILKTAEA
ncbi:MAG: hypothetical protein IJ435_01955 [Clostridia bacterium]|nr:hypothetical protein [Clostridia bacterium]